MNLLHFGKNNDPGHATNLSLHSRDVAGEARGIPCILEKGTRLGLAGLGSLIPARFAMR